MKQTKHQKMQRFMQISATAPKIELQGLESHFKPEEMPEVDPSPMGRHRLLQAFRSKYGLSYRNRRGVTKLIRMFDEQSEFIKKALKAGGV